MENLIVFLPPVEDCFDRIPVDFTNKELTYAVIATICENKRQDFYINTIIRYNKIYGAMHLIIGKIGESAYSKRVEELASNYKSINLMGEKTLDELEQIWNKIDIVVVPSYAETFSLVAAEAMMRSKICIVSNNCGISDYIVNGENGFVFECDNMAELAEKMDWCGKNRSEQMLLAETREIHMKIRFSDKAFILGLKNMLNPNCQSLSDDWKNYV